MAVAGLECGGPALAGPGDTKLISRQSQAAGGDGANAQRQHLVSRRSGGPGGDSFSDFASIAGGGRLVAFQTSADNLGGPIADVLNVYVHQLPRR